MSTRRSWVVAAAVVLAGVAGVGFHRAAAPPTSVAVVDMASLINDSAEAKSRADTLAKSVDPLKKELKDLQDSLEGKKKELELLPKGSKDYIAKLVEGEKVKAQFEAYGKLYQSLVDLQVAEMHRETYLNAVQAAQRVAKKDGFQLVLLDDRKITFPANSGDREVSTIIQSKRVVYADDAIDITARVLTDMDNTFNAPAPKSGAGK